MKTERNYYYSPKEELLNIISHGLGFFASLIAFPFLLVKALELDSLWKITSYIIYGISLLVLYGASTLYHASKHPVKRRKLNILDHAAIYVLIAGTYSPFCLVALNNQLGWYMFGFVWLFALIGITLKLFFTGKFHKISTAMYLFMGWQVVFFINPLAKVLPDFNLKLLILGGVFYSIGAILYSIKKIPFNHAIFHFFVLAGSISHFFSIYLLKI
jgi:hemolysin III